jgi:hypothetical protein
VLLRLSYLALTGMVTLLRLLPMSNTDKDIEILVLRHQLAVLQRRVDKPRLTPPDRAFLAALLHMIPRPTPRRLHLIVSPDTVPRWHWRASSAADCPAKWPSGTLTVRRALQRQSWQHGCDLATPCGRTRGADCPARHSGDLIVVEPKSRAGRRVLSLPTPLIGALLAHRQTQDAERTLAAELWQDGQWVFTQPTGRPIDPRADHAEWKALLAAAGVRDARLHDARHTAATMHLVLNVPSRTVMDLMGWSQLSMTQRYQHVPDQLRRDVADKLGRLLWVSTNDDDGGKDDGEGGAAGVLVPA